MYIWERFKHVSDKFKTSSITTKGIGSDLSNVNKEANEKQ